MMYGSIYMYNCRIKCNIFGIDERASIKTKDISAVSLQIPGRQGYESEEVVHILQSERTQPCGPHELHPPVLPALSRSEKILNFLLDGAFS